MTRHKVPNILPAIIAACLLPGAHAADTPQAINAPKHKKMKMEAPMNTEMKRKGMMESDVKDAAEKKAKKMQPMIEQEEKSMPQDNRGPTKR